MFITIITIMNYYYCKLQLLVVITSIEKIFMIIMIIVNIEKKPTALINLYL